MDEFANSMQEIEGVAGSIDGTLDSVVGITGSIMALIGVLGTVGTVVLGIVGAIVGALIWVALHILQSVPVYALAKKTGRKNAWIAWLPLPFLLLEELPRMFVVADIPGDKEVKLIGKFKLSSRAVSFWIWVGIYFFGNILWDFVMYILTSILTMTGVGALLTPVTFLLTFVPNVALAWLEYAFVRDVLNVFKEDKKSNNTVAIIVAVVDAIIPSRFARTVCLYSIMKKEPLKGEYVHSVNYTPVDERPRPQPTRPNPQQRPPQRPPQGANPQQRPPQRPPQGANPQQRPPQRPPQGANPQQRPPQRPPQGANPGQRPNTPPNRPVK